DSLVDAVPEKDRPSSIPGSACRSQPGDLPCCTVGLPYITANEVMKGNEPRSNEPGRLPELEGIASLAVALPAVAYCAGRRADGTVTVPYGSTGLKDLLGVEPQQVVEDFATLASAIHPEDRARFVEDWRRALADLRPLDGEYRLGGSGTARWCRHAAVPLRPPRGGVGPPRILVPRPGAGGRGTPDPLARPPPL